MLIQTMLEAKHLAYKIYSASVMNGYQASIFSSNRTLTSIGFSLNPTKTSTLVYS